MLSFTLEFNRSTYEPDQSPEATFVLKNTGPEPVVVNRRLTLNHPTEIEECREVYLRVLDEAGTEVPFAAYLNVSELTNEDFAPLAPGGSVQQTYNLADYYTFARPGSYTIQAFYENVFNPNPGEAWQGKLESNTVTFDLRGLA